MERKGKFYLYLMILFICTTILLCGFIIYDKAFKQDNDCTNNELGYSYNLNNRTIIQGIVKGYIRILVDTEGNAYLTLVGNLEYEEDEALKNTLLEIQKKFTDFSPKNYANYDGEQTLNAYKLDIDKVLNVHYVNIGNADYSYFIFIKEDHSLAYLSYNNLIDNGEISIKNIENIENVVTIVDNSYTHSPYAICIDGKEIDLYNYIK